MVIYDGHHLHIGIIFLYIPCCSVCQRNVQSRIALFSGYGDLSAISAGAVSRLIIADGKGHIGRIPNDEDENDNVDGEAGGDDGGDRG